ncbi:MAG: hypothetical protein K6V36_14065 [Anaerolineae bacterium]|jgi:hypothetical protein|nr:hypothetical protein [Anaerolineae bacterium]
MAERLEFGLLWYDGDARRPLTAKIEEAAACYERKFGERPNRCYVHDSCIDGEMEWRGVRILRAPNVLPNHFWIGLLRQQPGGASRR